MKNIVKTYFSATKYPKLCSDCGNLLFFREFKRRKGAGLRNYLKARFISRTHRSYRSTLYLTKEWYTSNIHQCLDCYKEWSDKVDSLLEDFDEEHFNDIQPIDFTQEPLKKYRINEFITLRLYEDYTYIYVKEEQFFGCMELLLNIPRNELEKTEQIQSIDIEQDYDNYMNGLKKDLDLENISLQDFDYYSYKYEMHKVKSLNDQYINKINGNKFECTPQ